MFDERKIAFSIWNVFSPIIFIVGTIGNTLTISVLMRRRNRNSNIAKYLTGLAVSDLLVLWIALPRSWLHYAYGIDIRSISPLICKIQLYLIQLGLFCSNSFIVILTYERFIYIWLPMKAKAICTAQKANIVIFSLLIFVIVLNLHFLFGMGHTEKNICYPITQSYANFYFRIWLPIIATFTVTQLLTLVVVNISIIIRVLIIRRNVQIRSTPQTVDTAAQARKAQSDRLTAMLITLNVVYMICVIPYMTFLTFYADTALSSGNEEKDATLELVWAIVNALFYTNNAINFILYFLSGSTFRQDVIKVVSSILHPCRAICQWVRSFYGREHTEENVEQARTPGLIPDIRPSLKPAPEPVLEDEMDYEDDTTTKKQMVTEQEDTRSVKIQRTVTQDVKKEQESGGSESEGEADKGETECKQKVESADDNDSGEKESGDDDGDEEEKKDVKIEIKEETVMEEGPAEEGEESKTKEDMPVKQTNTITATTKVKKEKRDKNTEIKLTRRLDSGGSALVKPDEPIKARRSPSPARNPDSKIIHISNLVRPFTDNQLKELLKRNGNLNEELFWIDKIKSHCFAVYDTEDEAIETRKALHNTTWPLSNPKTLIVDFGSEEQMDYYRVDEKPIPPPDKKERASLREQKLKEKEEKQRLIQEERQKEIERRQKDRKKRMKERLDKEERDKSKPVREWDKDKKSSEDWDRTFKKSRSRSPRDRRGHRSRSGSPASERRKERSRERSRDRTGRREKMKAPEKTDDEPPAKLLDDLSKKTKITPCIYRLPLTEAQVMDREKLRNAGIETETGGRSGQSNERNTGGGETCCQETPNK